MSKPTMDDVARRAGVSRALVSMTLSGSGGVGAASREAVLRAADELGYRRNRIASHLASRRTKTVGLLINDLHNPHHAGVADGIKRAADEHGYHLLMNSAFLNDRDERSALEAFIDYRVDGVLEIGARIPTRVLEAASASVPVVIVGRPMRSKLVDTVNNDDRRGAELATQHLIELGHEHIWHIDGGRGAGAPQRRRGFRATMERHGLTPHVVPATYTEASGAAAARQALRSGEELTAVFAGNDLSAFGALDSLIEAGRHVPGDVSVVGYDNTSVGALRLIGLTSVDQRSDELGARALEMLLERIEGGRTAAVHHVIPPSLVVRATTAAR